MFNSTHKRNKVSNNNNGKEEQILVKNIDTGEIIDFKDIQINNYMHLERASPCNGADSGSVCDNHDDVDEIYVKNIDTGELVNVNNIEIDKYIHLERDSVEEYACNPPLHDSNDNSKPIFVKNIDTGEIINIGDIEIDKYIHFEENSINNEMDSVNSKSGSKENVDDEENDGSDQLGVMCIGTKGVDLDRLEVECINGEIINVEGIVDLHHKNICEEVKGVGNDEISLKEGTDVNEYDEVANKEDTEVQHNEARCESENKISGEVKGKHEDSEKCENKEDDKGEIYNFTDDAFAIDEETDVKRNGTSSKSVERENSHEKKSHPVSKRKVSRRRSALVNMDTIDVEDKIKAASRRMSNKGLKFDQLIALTTVETFV